MEKEYFARMIHEAEIYERVDYSGFWNGYRRGLRKRYYHDMKMQFGDNEEHEKWMKAAESANESQRAHGEGYKCGYAGEDATHVYKVRKLPR